MKSRTTALVLIMLSLIFVGCNRGCTTAKTLQTEKRTIKVQGEKVTVIGRLVDYKTSRSVNRDVFKRSVSHSYAIEFDASFLGITHKDFFEEGVDSPDNVDLAKELRRVKVKISKDRKHVALGIDNQAIEIMHLYKGKPFSLGVSLQNTANPTSWSEVDINSYPSPEVMMTAKIKSECDFIIHEKEVLHEFLDNASATDSVHIHLMDAWPKCRFATEYYTKERVKRLKLDQRWNRHAEKKAMTILSEWEYYRRDQNVMEFVEGLESDRVQRTIDSVLVENWGGFEAASATSAVLDRINSTIRPFHPTQRKKIISEAKATVRNFKRTGNDNSGRSAEASMKIVLAIRDTVVSQELIQSALGPNARRFRPDKLVKVIYGNYQNFTPYQQKIIKEKTPLVFQYIKAYGRNDLYEAVVPIFECEQLKEWITKYPDDLKFESLPNGC